MQDQSTPTRPDSAFELEHPLAPLIHSDLNESKGSKSEVNLLESRDLLPPEQKSKRLCWLAGRVGCLLAIIIIVVLGVAEQTSLFTTIRNHAQILTTTVSTTDSVIQDSNKATSSLPLIPYPVNTYFSPSASFSVTVNRLSIKVLNASTFQICQFAVPVSTSFSLQINYHGVIKKFDIQPSTRQSRAAIRTAVNALQLQVVGPQKYEVRINDASLQALDGNDILYILMDPPETDVPSPTDPSVRYFGPGFHNIGACSPPPIYSQLYLAPGAVLNGSITLQSWTNFRVHGRGILRAGFQDKSESLFVMKGCQNGTVDGITLVDSPQHVIVFNSYTPKSSWTVNVTLENVKSLHRSVNSDGLSFFGLTNHVTVKDSLIIANDNLIVIGSGGPLGGPSYNTVTNTIFVKCGNAGNFFFPQGLTPYTGSGGIGLGNVFSNLDILRLNGEIGLFAQTLAVEYIQNIILDNIRVVSFKGWPGRLDLSHNNSLIMTTDTNSTGLKEITFQNMYWPYGYGFGKIASGNWLVNFKNVSVNGKLATQNSHLGFNLMRGSRTTFSH